MCVGSRPAPPPAPVAAPLPAPLPPPLPLPGENIIEAGGAAKKRARVAAGGRGSILAGSGALDQANVGRTLLGG